MPPRRALLNVLLCLPEDGPLRRKTSGGDKPTPTPKSDGGGNSTPSPMPAPTFV